MKAALGTDLSLEEQARSYLLGGAEAQKQAALKCAADVARAAEVTAESFRKGGKLLICGNGGSAAECQHLATEFVSTLTRDFERPALPAIALTTDTSFLTARANDFGFEGVFERQVEALGRRGDVLMGLSTSGNSENVLRAMSRASEIGMATVALTGGTGGRLAEVADISVTIPDSLTGHIQEAHLAVIHAFCYLVERVLYGRAVTS